MPGATVTSEDRKSTHKSTASQTIQMVSDKVLNWWMAPEAPPTVSRELTREVERVSLFPGTLNRFPLPQSTPQIS